MRVLLAPMEGVLDALVRELLTEVNDYDLCITEFVRVVDQLLPVKVFHRICPELHHASRTPSGTPVRIQLLGQHPQWLAENAARATALGSYGVDLNCGCPSKVVNGSGGGATLLKDPELIYQGAKAVEAQDGPQLDFSADIERQRMSAEGLMGPFAITDPAAGTTGPWYTNGTFGLTAGWDLDLWGKNRAEVTARIGAVKAREAEQEQTRQLLASGVARLYWEWQTQAALKNVLMQIEHEQQNVVAVNRELYQHGITSSVEGVETDIDASKTQQQLNDVNGKMKVIEARLSALTNTQSAALKLRQVSLPAVESQLPSQLGYSLLARRADLQAAHWYIESSLSSIDAAKAAFYPDINLMAFLQQDALHLSDLFRHSAQQYGITGGLTLPIFDSGRLNANLDIAKAQSNLSIANYNKAVVDAVNDVARAASQVETLAQKNQHQQQIEHDAQRVVGLAQARFNAGIIAGSRVSEAKIPALREQCNGLLLQGQWLDASIQLTSALGGGYHS